MGELNDLDPLEINNIPKSQGICIVDGDVITTDPSLKPLKIKKVNIGSIENFNTIFRFSLKKPFKYKNKFERSS